MFVGQNSVKTTQLMHSFRENIISFFSVATSSRYNIDNVFVSLKCMKIVMIDLECTL